MSVSASLNPSTLEFTSSTRQSRGAHLLSSLPQLQSAISHDPSSYQSEFLTQWTLQSSLLQLLLSTSSSTTSTSHKRKEEERFRELVRFCGNVGHLYDKRKGKAIGEGIDLEAWARELSRLALEGNVDKETKNCIVGTLVGIRRRGGWEAIDLLKFLFSLLSHTTSPSLRSTILKTILSDLKSSNTPTKNHKLNRAIQGLLFQMMEKGNREFLSGQKEGSSLKKNASNSTGKTEGGREGIWAIKLITELWRKGIWRDSKTVEIVRLGCFHSNSKVQSSSIHFFLSDGNKEDGVAGEDSDDDSEGGDLNEKDIGKIKHASKINKKTKARDREEKRKMKVISKKRKRKEISSGLVGSNNFSAIQLLLDPQKFVDDLYEIHLVKHEKNFLLEHKVLVIRLIGRLSGYHKLTLLSFYSHILKYLTHHQLHITSILSSIASSIHHLTPPDLLLPVVKKICAEFIHPGVASEVICVGLNSVREICKRQPLVMEGQYELVEDLVDYRKSGDKGVVMAARGLLAFWRENNPELLKKRERGKAATIAAKKGTGPQVKSFGNETAAGEAIEGLNLFAAHLASAEQEAVDEEDWKNWEVESSSEEEDSDDGEGWIDVSSDEDGAGRIEISDSDDGDGDKRKQKKRKVEVDEEKDDKENDKEEDEEKEKSEKAKLDALELATNRILTPADWAKISELRTKAAEEEYKASGTTTSKRKLELLKRKKGSGGGGDGEVAAWLNEGDIEGWRKKEKMTREERMESIMKGREGRDKFGSSKGKKKQLNPSSTTNEEKRKKKAFSMVSHSSRVRTKSQASLRDKQKRLRGHIDRIKKKGK